MFKITWLRKKLTALADDYVRKWLDDIAFSNKSFPDFIDYDDLSSVSIVDLITVWVLLHESNIKNDYHKAVLDKLDALKNEEAGK